MTTEEADSEGEIEQFHDALPHCEEGEGKNGNEKVGNAVYAEPSSEWRKQCAIYFDAGARLSI